MDVGRLARIAGVTGGLVWLARAATDQLDLSGSLVDALHWGGLALIAISLVGLGADLVSSSNVVLRVVVAICLPLLIWAVLETLRGQFSDAWVEGVFGLLLAGYCGFGLLGERTPRAPASRHRGTHAR